MAENLALAIPNEIPTLSLGAFRATTTGLVVDRSDGPAPVEVWGSYLMAIGRIGNASPWVIADVLLEGRRQYGEDVYQFVDIFAEAQGYAKKSLQNMMWVAERVPRSRRREPPVTFAHHAEIAALDEREQEAFLAAMERECPLRSAGRRAVKQWKGLDEVARERILLLAEKEHWGWTELVQAIEEELACDKRPGSASVTGLAENVNESWFLDAEPIDGVIQQLLGPFDRSIVRIRVEVVEWEVYQ